MNLILLLLYGMIEGISRDSSCDELLHFFDGLNPGSELTGYRAVSAKNRDGVEDGGHFEALNEYFRCVALEATSHRNAPDWDGFQEPQKKQFEKLEAKSFYKERNVPVVESLYEGYFDDNAQKVLVRLIQKGENFVIKPSGNGHGIGVLLFETIGSEYSIENLDDQEGREFPTLTKKQLLDDDLILNRRVRVTGLQKQAHLNDQTGVLKNIFITNDRHLVELDVKVTAELNRDIIKIKPENLIPEVKLRKDQSWFGYMERVLTDYPDQILIEKLIPTESELEIRQKPRSVPLEIKLSVVWGKVISVSCRPLDDPAFVWRRDGFLYIHPEKDNLWEKVNNRVGEKWKDIFDAAETVGSHYKYRFYRVDIFVPSKEKWFMNEVEYPDSRFAPWMPHGMPRTLELSPAAKYYMEFNNYFLSCSINFKDDEYLGFLRDGMRKFKISRGMYLQRGELLKVVPKRCNFATEFYKSDAFNQNIGYAPISLPYYQQYSHMFVFC